MTNVVLEDPKLRSDLCGSWKRASPVSAFLHLHRSSIGIAYGRGGACGTSSRRLDEPYLIAGPSVVLGLLDGHLLLSLWLGGMRSISGVFISGVSLNCTYRTVTYYAKLLSSLLYHSIVHADHELYFVLVITGVPSWDISIHDNRSEYRAGRPMKFQAAIEYRVSRWMGRPPRTKPRWPEEH